MVKSIPQYLAKKLVHKLRPQFSSNLAFGCALHTGAVVSRLDAIPPVWIIKGTQRELQDTEILAQVKL